MYSNMLDIIYCRTPEQADFLLKLYVSQGHGVGLSTVQITTGTEGLITVKKLDIYKKVEKQDAYTE